MEPILVTGASGFVGRHLVAHLRARGLACVAMARRAASAPAGVEVREADLTEPASLASAVAGVRSVVHLAGAADVTDAEVNRRVNVDGTAALGEACRAAGVGRVLLFSSHCAVRPLRDAYGETKRESEAALAATGVEHVIFRPTMIYGEGSKEWTTFVRTVRRLPLVPIIGSGRSVIRPVFLDDVLPAIVAALERPGVTGRAFEICGPAPVAFDDLVGLVAGHLGRRRRVLHVPGALAIAGARVLGAVVRHPPITVDQVMGFLQDTVADPGPASDALGFAPRSVEEGLEVLFARSPIADW